MQSGAVPVHYGTNRLQMCIRDSGNRGCLHTLAGFQELAEELREIYSEEKTPELVRMTQGHKEQVVGSRLREFYHAADPAVREVIEKGAFYLAMTLKNCLVMLNLSTVVVYGDLFFDWTSSLKTGYRKPEWRSAPFTPPTIRRKA